MKLIRNTTNYKTVVSIKKERCNKNKCTVHAGNYIMLHQEGKGGKFEFLPFNRNPLKVINQWQNSLCNIYCSVRYEGIPRYVYLMHEGVHASY